MSGEVLEATQTQTLGGVNLFMQKSYKGEPVTLRFATHSYPHAR